MAVFETIAGSNNDVIIIITWSAILLIVIRSNFGNNRLFKHNNYLVFFKMVNRFLDKFIKYL